MTPTKTLIEATLKLPIEARRALAEQPGPGWWVMPNEAQRYGIQETPDHPWYHVPRPDDYVEKMISLGWAWLPADSVAWMEAATPEGWRWYINNITGSIIELDGGNYFTGKTAPECALNRWGAL